MLALEAIHLKSKQNYVNRIKVANSATHFQEQIKIM